MTVSGVKEYDVLVDGVVKATVTGTSAIITGLAPSTEYDVTVVARDNAGNVSAPSAVLPVTTDAASGDGSAPTVPTGLGSSSIGTTTATVSWTPSTDNVGVTVYEVFVNGVSKGTTASASYNLTGLTAGTAHNVTVRAGDAAGNWSAQSAALVVTTEDAGVVPDMVAQWLFTEGSGSTAADEVSGKVLSFGNAPNWVAGPGTLDAVQVGVGLLPGTLSDLSTLQNAQRTIAFWARRDSSSTGAWMRGIAFKDGSTSAMLVAPVAGSGPNAGSPYGRARIGATDNNITPTAPTSVGTYHHYALTHDGTTARLFVDAVEIGSVTAAGSVANATSLTVGEGGGLSVADARVFSQALDATQLAAVMDEAGV